MANFVSFEDAIKAYLEKLAKNDELFAKTYAKKNKSLKECCNYIMAEAQKAAKGGKCIALSDEEVYNLAVHYYDEDDIKAPDEVKGASVAVSAKVAKEKPEPKARAKRTKAAKLEPLPEPKQEIEVAVEPEDEENYELDIPIF